MDFGHWQLPGMASRWLLTLLAWVVGTALQLMQPSLWPLPVYGLFVVLGLAVVVAVMLRGRHHAAAGLWLPVAVAALAFGLVGFRADVFQSNALLPELEGQDVLVTGVVAAMPQRQANGLRFQMDITSAQVDGLSVRLPPRIQIGWYREFGDGDRDSDAIQTLPEIWAGESWRIVVRVKAPHGNSNPGGFDYELWLWAHGVQATGYVRHSGAGNGPRRLGQTGRHPIEWMRQAVRQRIDTRLAHSAQAGWISALVTGDQNAIERADWDVFRATGVAHLMSISGLHITMFAWAAAALVGMAWRCSASLCLAFPAPHAALLGGLVLAFAYALFSGWGVPSQRTVGMLAVVCLLRLSGRSWPWPTVWLLAGASVLVIDPWALLQAGFWLSFLAVGVLLASGKPSANRGSSAWRGAVHAMLREQMIITLALMPLVLLLFGQMSTVGFVANLLAIPWITLLVTPLAMLGAILAPAWDVAAVAVGLLATVLAWLAQLPMATVSVASAPVWIGVAGVLGGWLLALRLPPALRIAGAALVLPVLLWRVPGPPVGEFELLGADVGQGNAVLVRTAHHALLYDAGPRYSPDSDAGNRVLLPLLRALGVNLDLLVLSHRDSDHVGGAESVLAMYPGSRLMGSIEPSHVLWSLRPGQRCAAGQSWNWDGVDISVLHPRAADYDAPAKPNTMSCVLRIQSAARPGRAASVALLAGDIESAQEKRLVSQAAALAADLLLVPHHGSKTSSSDAFLDSVSPRIALVQNGYRNRFGHPAADPMARYAARSIAVYESTRCGSLTWRSIDPEAVICNRPAQLRYWHHVGPAGVRPESRFK